MADDTGQPGRSGDGQHNPWAPPDEGVSLGKSGKSGNRGESEQDQQRRSVAEQPTVTSGSGAAPPPPVPPAPGSAPGGPGAGSASAYGPSSPYGPAQSPPGRQPGASHGYGHGQGQAYGQGGQTYGQGGPAYGQGYGHPPPGSAYGHPPSGPPPPYGYGYGYGTGPAHGPAGYGWHGAAPSNGKSVAALVLGIISMVAVSTCWGSFLGIITSPIALGLGLSARRGVDRGEQGGRGQAVAGFVMGIVGTVLSVLIITTIVLMFTVFREELEKPDPDSGDGPSIDARGSVTLVLDRTADNGV